MAEQTHTYVVTAVYCWTTKPSSPLIKIPRLTTIVCEDTSLIKELTITSNEHAQMGLTQNAEEIIDPLLQRLYKRQTHSH